MRWFTRWIPRMFNTFNKKRMNVMVGEMLGLGLLNSIQRTGLFAS